MNNIDLEIRNARILIVYDNPANVFLLEGMLIQEGYADVRTTTDSREVVAMHAEHRFDLILLDIRMPHLDGIRVMERLADKIGDDYLPILVLTAQADIETRKRALERGAKDFITKPFEQWEVLHRIRNMLETRVFYNRQRVRADVLDAEVRHRIREVRETLLEIVRRLGRAGEYRDNETGMHIIRMSRMCPQLTLSAGMGEQFADLMLYASPMHDVGKIGIPDHILLKPGKLDPDEFEIMKRHAEMGADIVGDHPSELLRLARSIAITHHEKWDGSGYPKGLLGTAIPIEGRIAALCDVFDALTSERPYKKAWPIEKAVAFIEENAGLHFDPDLAAAFIRSLPEMLVIRDSHADAPEHTFVGRSR